MTEQLDLFKWAEQRPSSVIDCRWRFEAKVIALVEGMINGRLPPQVDGKLIEPKFGRDMERGAA
ncbi:hypothetical protein [Rhizobium sp. L245/93]|uniref:hypothetical protein n=1 Tax=Rhizobium sp. L245/93 TaxID=2819998 RepID=UPI001ADA5132|nr:hypothetical protein [Rhizobium sp. L245/93]MBO9168341.1 hypothetical protein [Rhizobium sp. L245/93]